ncbi:energy-coupling factor ABC transporter ATP-binding protein [Wolinella succinogenes]|uniref:PUTATIVE ABC-TRANSPORT SYSTEM ATP-BINDING PROTEIN n=1 Tax=Wolinella succinogenes (strain ATCC 29543 / DSM 1740 / CCUG 13145 / JCM 31913 / LMG 7466 / NCTC 11488 / FDC 602W) TaxID=273121 RepID=Q7M8V7_WOLSU|nr:ABC transporter ATP-binding protein [Wolinella succinogenes]CAE10439.1 PUTATIVE ABC-TRANSPORT SYSTEM ATP-BINDING PROTEIN [Wolinella succinogenes]VEG80575.1 Lipoprotein-releasing system ATP-binding protein LolD [Wolinella succinogenes]HCZ19722.1 ABC transporter ATP-binding protein [Helicobacter sp.]
MNQPLYSIRQLRKTYLHKPVLNLSSLEINEGEIIGIVGSNGSGKSTLLRHLAFLESPDSGEILYKGHPAGTLSLETKREVSILFPEPYLLKRSVEENLLYGLLMQQENLTQPELYSRANEALELVGLRPDKFLHRSWHELSSGETQRIALASRLILRPKTLLLDEPTNSLDFSGIPQFSEAILHANQNWGTTVIIASHDLIWLGSLAQRQIGLHFGRLMEFSTSNLILGRWEEETEGLIYRFSDGQKIQLPQGTRIGSKRGVAIDPRHLRISHEKPLEIAPKETTLEGQVVAISHLKKSDEISLKLSVGNQTLEGILDFQAFSLAPFYPSQKAFITFDLEHLQTSWMKD